MQYNRNLNFSQGNATFNNKKNSLFLCSKFCCRYPSTLSAGIESNILLHLKCRKAQTWKTENIFICENSIFKTKKNSNITCYLFPNLESLTGKYFHLRKNDGYCVMCKDHWAADPSSIWISWHYRQPTCDETKSIIYETEFFSSSS